MIAKQGVTYTEAQFEKFKIACEELAHVARFFVKLDEEINSLQDEIDSRFDQPISTFDQLAEYDGGFLNLVMKRAHLHRRAKEVMNRIDDLEAVAFTLSPPLDAYTFGGALFLRDETDSKVVCILDGQPDNAE